MAMAISKFLWALSSLVAVGHSIPTNALVNRQSGLNSWIQSQDTRSLSGVLANIGPNGAYAYGANAGVVLASPSKSNPDCKSLP